MTETVLHSATKSAVIGFGRPFCVIGERINPTGRKKLAEAMMAGDFSGVIADALAKGVFILGPDRGMALIEKLPQVEGVIVSAKNEVSISSGLRGRLMVLAPPTDAP